MVGQSTVFYKTPPNEHAVDLKTTFTVGIITVQEGTNYSCAAPTNIMKSAVLLCLVGLLAASLTEHTLQTEQVDDEAGLEREVREAQSEVETGAASYKEVMSRQKRHRE
ncbi:hypothetical protein NP493_1373g00029 [Ridgeia piscesae]|uniref:Uncharacterized protein n=1 Tax=Ridgeia piscesae TaxID=27915 RepID=A0AAD9K5D5_RIDPI|nr:hypothetical protein NP493_1373g00029 [Ridgeia piscesae]